MSIDGSHARLSVERYDFEALIGRSGVISAEEKREGDGATPLGRWPVLFGFYRPDRVPAPAVPDMDWRPMDAGMGWCDAPDHPLYNQLVPLPFSASHEVMCREDSAYDYVVVLGYNYPHAVSGRGSAIFLHIWREGAPHTEGCVALKRADFEALLPYLRVGTVVEIGT